MIPVTTMNSASPTLSLPPHMSMLPGSLPCPQQSASVPMMHSPFHPSAIANSPNTSMQFAPVPTHNAGSQPGGAPVAYVPMLQFTTRITTHVHPNPSQLCLPRQGSGDASSSNNANPPTINMNDFPTYWANHQQAVADIYPLHMASARQLFEQHYQQQMMQHQSPATAAGRNDLMQEHDREVLSRTLQQSMEQATMQSRAASAAAIEALKSSKASQSHIDANASCSICLSEFELNDATLLMPCDHQFHNDCLLTWLRIKNSCPCCRRQISSDETAAAVSVQHPASTTTATPAQVLPPEELEYEDDEELDGEDDELYEYEDDEEQVQSVHSHASAAAPMLSPMPPTAYPPYPMFAAVPAALPSTLPAPFSSSALGSSTAATLPTTRPGDAAAVASSSSNGNSPAMARTTAIQPLLDYHTLHHLQSLAAAEFSALAHQAQIQQQHQQQLIIYQQLLWQAQRNLEATLHPSVVAEIQQQTSARNAAAPQGQSAQPMLPPHMLPSGIPANSVLSNLLNPVFRCHQCVQQSPNDASNRQCAQCQQYHSLLQQQQQLQQHLQQHIQQQQQQFQHAAPFVLPSLALPQYPTPIICPAPQPSAQSTPSPQTDMMD